MKEKQVSIGKISRVSNKPYSNTFIKVWTRQILHSLTVESFSKASAVVTLGNFLYSTEHNTEMIFGRRREFLDIEALESYLKKHEYISTKDLLSSGITNISKTKLQLTIATDITKMWID